MGKWIQKKNMEKMRGGIARGRPSASAGAVQQGCPAGERCCLVGTSTKVKRRTSKNATHLMKYLSYDAILSWDIVRWCLHENGFRACKSRAQKMGCIHPSRAENVAGWTRRMETWRKSWRFLEQKFQRSYLQGLARTCRYKQIWCCWFH